MKKLEAKPPVVKRPRNRPSRSKVGARWLPARAQSQTDNRLRRQQGQHADPLGIRAGFATGLWRPKTCQWIAGEPCASDTCKCGAKTKDGLPWCARHFVRIYTGVRAA